MQGDTLVVKKSGVNFQRLGAAPGGVDTFSWESQAKVYVCTQPWTAHRVRDLLEQAVSEHMAGYSVEISVV